MRRSAVLVGTMLACIFACKDGSRKSAKATKPHTEVLYDRYCRGCHGKTGDRRFNGAADLTVSTLDEAKTILVISEGKGKMIGYGKFLDEDAIAALAEYVNGLRKN